jgi:CheY-like chemotaxis protein
MDEKKKVLLIDDEKDFCFFLKNNLERTGRYNVMVANDGESGISLVKLERPDVILLDIMMPKVSGPDVADAILQDASTKSIPILFLTALVTEEEIGFRLMREIGGRNFIAKPVEIDRIVNCIENALHPGALNQTP